jgi:hypothetical protein
MFPMTRRLRAALWISRLAILLGVGFMHVSPAVLLLVIAFLVSTLSVEIPCGRGPALHALTAAVILAPSVAITAVLVTQRSGVPAWLVVVAALYVLWGIVAGVFDVIVAARSDVRQTLFDRALRRGWPTSTI